MRRLIRILAGLLLFFILLLSISFSLLNRTPLPLDLGLVSLPPQPFSVWIITAFCLGGLLGLLLGARFVRGFRSRHRLASLRKELVQKNREIVALQTRIRRQGTAVRNTDTTEKQIG